MLSIIIKRLMFVFLMLLLPILFTLMSTPEVYAKYKPVKETPTMIDSNLTIERVFKGQFEPSSFAFLGNKILVLDRDRGIIKVVQDGLLHPEPALDVNVSTDNFRGLLGIAVYNQSKSLNTNSTVFLYYSESPSKDGSDEDINSNEEPLGNRVYKFDFINNRLVNPVLLFDLSASSPGPRHIGGVIAIGPDKNLYLSTGEGNGTFNKVYQNKAINQINGNEPDGRAGILRMSLDGGVVEPVILGHEFPLNHYYAYGIRNSFGYDWDPITGDLWDTENGPWYGDEINLVKPGFNSGWASVQGIWKPRGENIGDLEFDPQNLVTFNGKGEYSPPEFIWKDIVAPTAIKFLNSDKYGPELKNEIFVGAANTGTIYHFELNNDRKSLKLKGMLQDGIADSPIELTDDVTFAKGFGRVTDIEVGPDGYIYILSQQKKGERGAFIHKIVPK
jgi:glucose/arabinose dehydrogenase